MRVLMLTIVLCLCSASVAQAGRVTVPALNAFDNYGSQVARENGWDYVEMATVHGDYRHAYATLVFEATYGDHDDVEATWELKTRLSRCGRGWYVLSSVLDRERCPVPWRLPRW